jgi:hypothetical protein
MSLQQSLFLAVRRRFVRIFRTFPIRLLREWMFVKVERKSAAVFDRCD